MLMIADVSRLDLEREAALSLWVSIFFPPDPSPYSPPQLEGSARSLLPALFPVLTLRPPAPFFEPHGGLLPPQCLGDFAPSLFQKRACALIDALSEKVELFQKKACEIIDAPVPEKMELSNALRDPRSVATVLEYCSHLWLRSLAQAPGAPSGEALERLRSWVARQVLRGRPFAFSVEHVLVFYHGMLKDLGEWLRGLQALLPADELRPPAGEGELLLHLASVVLGVLSDWLADVRSQALAPAARRDLRASWAGGTVARLLATFTSRLQCLEGHDVEARSLLDKLNTIAAEGDRLCDEH